MLDGKAPSDAGEPGGKRHDRGEAPKPVVDENDNIGLKSSKKPNPIQQRPRSLFAGDDLHIMISTQPLTEKIHLKTEYANLNSWLPKSAY
jgi:hypothetical protein